MSDTANPTELQATVDRLTTLAGGVRKALNLPDDADDAAILSALGTTTAEVSRVKAERDAERIDAAITQALGKSTMIQANAPDAMTVLRPLFQVDDKGRVVTKGGDTGEVPGMDAAQFVASRLPSLRGHWFPPSTGGGSRGGGALPVGAGDAACFRTGNVTEQMALIARIGEKATIDACRRQGITPPSWLTKGVR